MALYMGRPAMQPDTFAEAERDFPGTLSIAINQDVSSAEDYERRSEDCLFLNLWTPGCDNHKRPVMVWLHGGGFSFGSGNLPFYNGHNLAKHHDVVLLTVNHRVNAFGFLNVADIGGDPSSGNAGMLDVVQALGWVRDNISRFGGDPDCITIFGQSGGGGKVSALMAMPAAKGLFTVPSSKADRGCGRKSGRRREKPPGRSWRSWRCRTSQLCRPYRRMICSWRRRANSDGAPLSTMHRFRRIRSILSPTRYRRPSRS